jgi:hypothetical protein
VIHYQKGDGEGDLPGIIDKHGLLEFAIPRIMLQFPASTDP